MKFQTISWKPNSTSPHLLDVYINIEIKKERGLGTIDYTCKHFGRESRNSILKATKVFKKFNPNFFKDKRMSIHIELINNEDKIIYSSNFITTLILAGFICEHYSIKPPRKAIILGDTDEDGKSIKKDFNLIKTAKAMNLYSDYKFWINLSYVELKDLLMKSESDLISEITREVFREKIKDISDGFALQIEL